MAADEKAEHNAQDAARKKEERRGMAADEKAEHNAQDAARMEKKRRGMSADEKAKQNSKNADRMKRCREQEADQQDYQDPVITGMVRPGFKSAVRYTEQIFRGDLEAEPFTIGSERRPCDYCGAQLFANEIQRSGNQRDGYIYYGKGLLCCRKNKIKLPKWAMPEEGTPARDILKLWEEDSELGRFLREYSRKVMSPYAVTYNNLSDEAIKTTNIRLRVYVMHVQCMNAMALCSLGMTDLPPPPDGNPWTPTLVIQGRVYERIGGLAAPDDGVPPRFNQIYLYDPREGQPSPADVRLRHITVPRNKQAVARRLLDYLHEKMLLTNRYVQDFKTCWERAGEVEAEQGYLHIPEEGVAERPAGQHERRYNLAEGLKEVQVLIPDGEGDKPPDRDIVLKPRGGNDDLRYIPETHRSYDPLHYTLFFPEGSEEGWNLGMFLNAARDELLNDLEEIEEDGTMSQRYRDYYLEMEEQRGRGERAHRLTPRDFTAFHLHSRDDERDTLLRGRRAFQEYLCMSYAKVILPPSLPNSQCSPPFVFC